MADSSVTLKLVHKIFKVFIKYYHKKDFKSCKAILKKLKTMLSTFPSLPPTFKPTPNAAEELLVARDIFEHAVALSLKTENEEAFDKNFRKLKQFYDAGFVAGDCFLPPSPHEDVMLSLYLLRLLVKKRSDEFGEEMERIACMAPHALEKPCMKDVVELWKFVKEEGGSGVSALLARQLQAMEGDICSALLGKLSLKDKGDMKVEGGICSALLRKLSLKDKSNVKVVPSLKLINRMIKSVDDYYTD